MVVQTKNSQDNSVPLKGGGKTLQKIFNGRIMGALSANGRGKGKDTDATDLRGAFSIGRKIIIEKKKQKKKKNLGIR